jgi:hypothetical protein
MFGRLRDQRLACVGVTHLGRCDGRVVPSGTQFRRKSFQILDLAAREHDPCASLGENVRGGAPDAVPPPVITATRSERSKRSAVGTGLVARRPPCRTTQASISATAPPATITTTAWHPCPSVCQSDGQSTVRTDVDHLERASRQVQTTTSDLTAERRVLSCDERRRAGALNSTAASTRAKLTTKLP